MAEQPSRIAADTHYSELGAIHLYTGAVRPADLDIDNQALTAQDPAVRQAIRNEALSKIACLFVGPLIDEGRKGIVITGGRDTNRQHAHDTSQLLSSTLTPRGQVIRSTTIGDFRGSSIPQDKAIRDSFHSRKLDVVTAALSHRSLTQLAPFDFAVTIGHITQERHIAAITDWAGRSNTHFTEVILGQFAAVGFGSHYFYDLTFASYFGQKEIHQGSAVPRSAQPPEPVERSWPEPLSAILKRTAQLPVERVFLQAQSQAQDMPHGYLSLEEVIGDRSVNHVTLRQKLRRLGYKSVTRYTPGPDGKLVRRAFYEPAAVTVLDAIPQPPQDGGTVERQPEALPVTPHRFPLNEVIGRLDATHREVTGTIRELKDMLDVRLVRRGSTERRTVPWATVEYLERTFGLAKGHIVIDYGRLPEDELDTDPKRIAYAQDVQRQLLDRSWRLEPPTQEG